MCVPWFSSLVALKVKGNNEKLLYNEDQHFEKMIRL